MTTKIFEKNDKNHLLNFLFKYKEGNYNIKDSILPKGNTKFLLTIYDEFLKNNNRYEFVDYIKILEDGHNLSYLITTNWNGWIEAPIFREFTEEEKTNYRNYITIVTSEEELIDTLILKKRIIKKSWK